MSLTEHFTETDLKSLSELNPPALMPNGNVGTPLKVFLQLIQSCRLPPRLIRKLGLVFPKTSSNRRYGNVPFQYRNSCTLPATEETVLTAAGHEISGPGTLPPSFLNQKKTAANTETENTDTDESETEEKDAQSDVDDVSLISCMSFLFFLQQMYCILIMLCLSVILFIVACRMMTAVRSGSAMRLYMRI